VKETQYLAPKTLDEALELLAEYGDRAVVLAGGTDVGVDLNLGKSNPDVLVYIGHLSELNYIKEEGGALRIGALATHADIASSPLVMEKAGVLAEAAATIGGPAIRNAGTVGGNIVNASPASDAATPLLAMGASVKLVSAKGERTLPLADFFVGPGWTAIAPGELVAEISIPLTAAPSAGKFLKLGNRKAMICALVNTAAVVSFAEGGGVQDVRIALGSVAPTPVRAYQAEAELQGKSLTPDLIAKAGTLAAEAASPIDDARASAWYRKEMVKVLVERALTQIAGAQ
jgi:CO/xanthine dehydrogenase FAD-binding subunit